MRSIALVLAILLLCCGFETARAGFVEITEEALGSMPPDVPGWAFGCWPDVNNDGWPDLHISVEHLYLNDGDGTFTPAGSIGLETEHTEAYRATWADADNDGDLDCVQSCDYVTTASITTRVFYFENSGAPAFTFSRYPVHENPENNRANTPVFLDGDGDGFLELYQTTFGNWTPNYSKSADRYFEADGGETWADITATCMPELELYNGQRHSRGVVACDYDNDRDVDIFVPVYGVDGSDPSWKNFLWQNDGSGVFTNVAAEAGVDIEPHGRYGIGLASGASWGDYDNDGDFDLAVANIHGRLAVYRNNGNGGFTNMSDTNGLPIGQREWHNSLWLDYDNDGDLDILGTQWYENRAAVVYENEGPENLGRFHEVTPDQGFEQTEEFKHVDGIAAADIERDGDMDLYFFGGGDEFRGKHLFRNDLDPQSDLNHWLMVGLQGDGVTGNRTALGAKVRLRFSDGWSGVRQVESTSADGMMNMHTLHFGLAERDTLEEIFVTWPYGACERWSWSELGQPLDEYIELVQGSGSEISGLLLVAGPGPAETNDSLVRAFYAPAAPAPLAQWQAYGVPKYGANVACGDLDGNGSDEILTGAGPGPVFGPHVRGFDPWGGAIPGVSFLAYGTNKWGVNVAAGDIDGDGSDEVITGAGPGAVFGPHVRGWNVDQGMVTPMGAVSYFAYGTLKYGVNVSAGDIDGDGMDEIVTGAGPGAVFGPHVRGWNHDGGGSTTAMPRVSFLAFGTPRWGVNVACGDIDGDGMDEIICGAGPSAQFGPHVRGWNSDGSTAAPMAGVSWFAYDGARYGVVVGAGDVDNDGTDEILTMPGPDPSKQPHLRAWNADGGVVTLVESLDFDAFDDPSLTHGGRVAGGRLF